MGKKPAIPGWHEAEQGQPFDISPVTIGWQPSASNPEEELDAILITRLPIHLPRGAELYKLVDSLIGKISTAGQDPNVVLGPFGISIAANSDLTIRFEAKNGETLDLDQAVTGLIVGLTKIALAY